MNDEDQPISITGFSSQNEKNLIEKMGMLSVAPSLPQTSVTPPPESGRPSTHNIPDQILSNIFLLALEGVRRPPENEEVNFPPYGRRVVNHEPTTQPFVLSQICRQWRMVSTNTPSLWTTLRLWHTNHPEIWRLYISRSGEQRMDIEICLPKHQSIELWDRPRIYSFKRIFKAVRGCSDRIQTLSIHAPNPTVRIILNDVFEHIHFPSLEKLKVSQAGEQPLCFFGPMSFNHNVFRSLDLYGVMVTCYATCLAGVEELNLVGSSGSLLDQENLTHLTYPAIPPGPTMTCLRSMMLIGTYPIPNLRQSGSATVIPLQPSFSINHLTFLHLSNFGDVKGSISVTLTCLFKMICHAPVLESLRLEAFDDIAFRIFIEEVEGCAIRPPYPRLRWLHMTYMPMAAFERERRFLEAFPELQQLTLVQSYAMPISLNLTDHPTFCPKLSEITVDGNHFNRDMRPVTF